MKSKIYFLLLVFCAFFGCEKDNSVPIAAKNKIKFIFNGKVYEMPASINLSSTSYEDLADIRGNSGNSNDEIQGVIVYFKKPLGSGIDKYTFSNVTVLTKSSINTKTLFENPTSSIKKTSKGWSGTFSAVRYSGNNTIEDKVEEGTFTDITE